jgi:queuosine precursor transporter
MYTPPTMHSTRFVFIACLFTATLLISNTVASKIALYPFGLVESAATILFPLTYIFGDILTEVYGYKKSRIVIWSAFACLLLMSAAYWLAQLMPAADFWDQQPAFDTILGAAPRIALASMFAFLIGEFTNAYIMSRMKVRSAGKHLYQRTIGSTLVGQGVDTVLFNVAAFAFVFSWSEILAICISGYILKVGVEVLFTPVTYKIVAYLKEKEGVDAYDTDISYSPFRA